MISVVMSVYHENLDYLRMAITSILAQDYSDFEFLIVDDDPSDEGLFRKLHEWEVRDKRIRIVKNENNMGLALSLNHAIQLATGEYVARMDSDDIAHSDRLRKQLAYLQMHPDVAILGTNVNIIDEDGNLKAKASYRPQSKDQTKALLSYSNIMVHSSVMMRKETLIELGMYRNFYNSEDADLWARAVTAGVGISNLDAILMDYRINSQGASIKKAAQQIIIGRYIRQLTKEREKNGGSDSFSVENLNGLLAVNHATSADVVDKFRNAKISLERSRIYFKKARIVSGIYFLSKAYLSHSYMREIINNSFKTYILKRWFLTINRFDFKKKMGER